MIHFIPRSAYVEYLLGMVEKSIADSTSLADTSGEELEKRGGGERRRWRGDGIGQWVARDEDGEILRNYASSL